MASPRKHGMAFDEAMSDERLRELLAAFHARRTLTQGEVRPEDCAPFLAGPAARCTTGQVIPGGWGAHGGVLAVRAGAARSARTSSVIG